MPSYKFKFMFPEDPVDKEFLVEVPEEDVSKFHLSGLLKDMLEELDDVNEIPIMNKTKKATFVKLYEFLDMYKKDPMENITFPIKTKCISELKNLQPSYVKFIQDIDKDNINNLYDLINLADYMDLKPLLDLSMSLLNSICYELASRETFDEQAIRNRLDCHYVPSKEEEEESRRMHPWLYEIPIEDLINN